VYNEFTEFGAFPNTFEPSNTGLKMNGSTGFYTHSPSVAAGKKEAGFFFITPLQKRSQPLIQPLIRTKINDSQALGLWTVFTRFQIIPYVNRNSPTKTQVNFEMAVFTAVYLCS
jgi:hypothetical protein